MSARSPARQTSQGAPPSSPRLPSPPPLPELQLGPRSPSVNAPPGELSLDSTAVQDDGAARRVRPGTGAADMATGPPFVPLHQLESPFQLQEYLKSSYSKVTREENATTITVKPITKGTALQLATPPIQQDTGEPVDRNLWLYELCRFLVQRTNRLIVSFFSDSPPCSSQTCAEMRASEWQYLCAVHEPPKSCCAIDYCCHTLDWAANVLTSPKHFPSRLSLGGEGGNMQQPMRQITNIFRRVYRIYAHAWFQHRDAFWTLEQEEGLYKFFRTVCDAYSLIPEDNYTIPSEAEGEREDMLETPVNAGRPDFGIPRNDTQVNLAEQKQQQPSQSAEREESATPTTPAAAIPTTTTRRHRHTPSTGTQVNPIAEGPEEEDENSTNNITQISQQVLSEPAATSSTQLSSTSSPSKPHSRSPRPGMSISIEGTQAENMQSTQDPTPTPEHHQTDSFFEQSDSEAPQSTTPSTVPAEQSQPTTEAFPSMDDESGPTEAETPSQPLPFRTPIPTLNTTSPPPSYTEEQEIRSPGGGSIRTIGSNGDILSGILAHCDVDSDGNPVEPQSQSHSYGSTIQQKADATSEGEGRVPEIQENDAVPETQAGKKTDAEDDEEMGEISLEKTTTVVRVGEGDEYKAETTGKDEQPKAEEEKKLEPDVDEKEKKEDSNADGTKTEDAPAGVA